MADDTRQQPDTPNAEQTPPTRPKGPANIMPGGSAHTAGGTPADSEVSYIDVVKSLGPEYYLNFHKRPCVRDSQLTGIGAGFVIGSLAAIARRPVYLATNYAVFGWMVFSCGSYQYCQYTRNKEKNGMRLAHELMEKKRATVEAKREARRKAREEHDRLEEAKRLEEERKRSWGYWMEKNVKFW